MKIDVPFEVLGKAYYEVEVDYTDMTYETASYTTKKEALSKLSELKQQKPFESYSICYYNHNGKFIRTICEF